MLLMRSLSAPIPNSWLAQHNSRDSSQETESQLQRKSNSLHVFSSKSIDGHSGELLHQTHSHEHKEHKDRVLKPSNQEDNNNKNQSIVSSKQRRSSFDETLTSYRRRSTLDPSSTFLVERLFSSSGLGEKATDAEDRLETLVSGGGGGGGSSGGKICNGGGVGGSGVDDGGSVDATEAYYKEMIELNPENSLLTGNYAKFLKEVKGDMKKAEEYCERAILGNTNDGNVLSLYADLILDNHRDRKRAHSYYQQAVNMSPEDSYVQASYARFLWDADEDEEDEEEEQKKSDEMSYMNSTSTSFRDFQQHNSITTASS